MSQPVSPAEAGNPYPEYLMEPTHIGEDPIVVERVYAQPPEESPEPRPDVDSHVEFTDYAYERFDPRDPGTEPTIITYPIGQVPEYGRRRDGWVANWTPRLSAGLLVASFAVSHVVGNFASLKADAGEIVQGLLHNTKQTVSRWLGHEQPKTQEISHTEEGGVIILNNNYLQPVGESAPSPADVEKLLGQIQDAQSRGCEINKVIVFAGSSDEWGPDERTLQVPNQGNDAIDDQRANDAVAELQRQAAAAGVELPEIEVASAEDLLSPEEVADLKAEAAEHGLTLNRAIAIYNRGGKLPASLQALMQSKFGDARAVNIRVELQEPDRVVTETVEVKDTAPENKDHDYDLYWFGTIPPIPRYRREQLGTKTAYAEWERPGTEPDERWVELYKEAIENGAMPRDAWRFSRKYQLLAREDRIDYSLTHRYTDAEGQEQEMRVMFIDHDPTDATIAMYQELLTAVSEMKDGKIAERWSAVAVFPRDQVGLAANAGRDANSDYPHHPADIGLGIDRQERSSVLGVAMPALGLIEVHMPENPTAEELNGYFGALFTSGHEFSHAADTNDEDIVVIPVGPPQLQHYRTTNPWAYNAQEAYDALPPADAPGERVITTTRQLVTAAGEVVTLHDTVRTETGDNTILGEAQHAILHNRRPDNYSSASPLELFGQVGGQVLSDAFIPFDEAGLGVQQRHPDLGRGYAVDPQLRRLYEQRTGWSRHTARPVNPEEFTLTEATDDPYLREFIDNARRTPMPNDRITILAGVVGLEDKKSSYSPRHSSEVS